MMVEKPTKKPMVKARITVYKDGKEVAKIRATRRSVYVSSDYATVRKSPYSAEVVLDLYHTFLGVTVLFETRDVALDTREPDGTATGTVVCHGSGNFKYDHGVSIIVVWEE